MEDIKESLFKQFEEGTASLDDIDYTTKVLFTELTGDEIGEITEELVRRYPSDLSMAYRAWYFVSIARDYVAAAPILKTIGETDSNFIFLLNAEAELMTSRNADEVDDKIEDFASRHIGFGDNEILQTASLFVKTAFADIAEKWLLRYKGDQKKLYHIFYAETHFIREEFHEARKSYIQSLLIDPSNDEEWNRYADISLCQHQYKDAIRASMYATGINPDNSKAEEKVYLCSSLEMKDITKKGIKNLNDYKEDDTLLEGIKDEIMKVMFEFFPPVKDDAEKYKCYLRLKGMEELLDTPEDEPIQ